MGRINRWSYEQKVDRENKIGRFIPCPICRKNDGLATWEGERFLKCQHCGANYQKKQLYVRKRDKPQ